MDCKIVPSAEKTEALALTGFRLPELGGEPRSANEVGPAQLTPRRLIAGATSATLAQLIAMASSFCLIPYVVHHIGEEAYGLWAVTGAVTAYFMLLDCGVGAGFVKYLAEFLERGDYNEARQVMTFGLLFYSALGALAFPAVYFLAPHVVAYLKVSPGNDTTATNLLLLALGYLFANAGLAVFSALIMAMQRSDISGMISSIGQVVYVASVLVFVRRNYGVYSLPAALFLALAFITLARLTVVYRTFGSPWLNPMHCRVSLVKKLFKFGVWIQLTGLSAVINVETDRIILAAFVSVTSVTYYELGNRLARLSMVLPWAVLGVLLPAASAIDGRGDDWRLNLMYVRTTRYVTMAAVLMAGFLVGAGEQILRVWMGSQYPYVIPIMVALLLSYTINGMTGAGTMIVRATGQPQYETYYALLSAAINVAATIVLTPLFGIMGVVGGTVIGTVIGSAYFLWIFHDLRGLGWKTPIIDWLWRLAAGTGAGSVSLWVSCHLLIPSSWFASRAGGVLALSALSMIYAGTCGMALQFSRFWESNDANLVRQVAPAMAARLFRP